MRWTGKNETWFRELGEHIKKRKKSFRNKGGGRDKPGGKGGGTH